MSRALLCLAAVPLVLSTCAPVVDAQFSDIVVTRPDISIPPAPSAAVSSVTFSFSINSSKLGASTKPEAQNRIVAVQLHRLALTAKTGISDLSFLRTLHAVACIPVGSTGKDSSRCSREVEIADYARTSTNRVGPTFEVPIPEPVDLLPLLRPTKTEPRLIVVIVSLGGELPTSPWTADISMSLSIEIRQ